MNVPAIIDWFFALTSGINIDFREVCKWWNGRSSVLAYDRAKVGINFKNTFVTLIERLVKEEEMTSQS